MERVFIVIVIGIIGGVLAERYRFPGGAIVGSMLASGIATMAITDGIGIPASVSTTVQIMLGLSLGLTFDSRFLQYAPKVLPLAVVSTIVLLLVAVSMAWIANRLGLVDFGTALFGLSPGGMSGMALIAKSEGYITPVVAFLHIVRIFTLFVFVPILVRLFFVMNRGS